MSARARAAARTRAAAERPGPNAADRTTPPVTSAVRASAVAYTDAARTRTQLFVRWMWVPRLAVMLGGIVFLNAATLRLSTRSSLTLQRTSEAQSEIVNLNQALQQTDAQVRNAASRQLGMRQEVASQVTILSAPSPTP